MTACEVDTREKKCFTHLSYDVFKGLGWRRGVSCYVFHNMHAGYKLIYSNWLTATLTSCTDCYYQYVTASRLL